MASTITKSNYIKITLKKYTQKSGNILITPICTKKKIMLKKHTYKKHPKHTHNPLFLLKITFKSKINNHYENKYFYNY